MTQLDLDPRALAECCGSRHWQELMAAGMPYGSGADLSAAAAHAFDALSHEDWLEAFAAHSTLGAIRPGDWTGAQEQSGLDAADAELRTSLAAANVEYRARFGFVFLIRAKGRGVGEILARLHERLDNPPAVEFANACEQQREITALRLERLERLAGDLAERELPVDTGPAEAAS